jgi:hypothetical protein
VSDPRPLFDALTRKLGLPAIWQPFDALGWSSGGVGFGNVTLEAFTPARGHEVAVELDRGVLATAFEPAADALAELDRREIPRGFPFPYQGAPPSAERPEMLIDPGVVPPFTTTLIGGFLGDRQLVQTLGALRGADKDVVASAIEMSRDPAAAALIVATGTPSRPWLFLCEYHDGLNERRRAASQKALEEAEGGALGISRVLEVVYAVEDLDEERGRWATLLEPLIPAPDSSWRFADGPAVRLEQASTVPGQRIVCEVKSIDAATRSLDALGLRWESHAEAVAIVPSAIVGLEIWLVP